MRILALPLVRKQRNPKSFEQTKSALHLDRAAETQMNPMTGLEVFGCLLLFLSGHLLKRKLFGLVWVLGPAALCPAGTPPPTFPLSQGGGEKCMEPRQRAVSRSCTVLQQPSEVKCGTGRPLPVSG